MDAAAVCTSVQQNQGVQKMRQHFTFKR